MNISDFGCLDAYLPEKTSLTKMIFFGSAAYLRGAVGGWEGRGRWWGSPRGRRGAIGPRAC